MTFIVEKHIPFPDMGASSKYPFGTIEIGDSFFLKKELRAKISSAARYYGIRKNKKFSVKASEEGYRCWRVK